MIRRFLLRTFCDEARRHLWLVSGAFFLFLLFVAGALASLAKLPPQTVAYGVSVGPFDVGGMSYEEARRLVANQTEAMENRGIDFVYKNISVNFSSVHNSLTNPDLSIRIYDYDVEKSLAAAYGVGNAGNVWQNAAERLRVRLFGKKIPLEFLFRDDQLLSLLRARFSQWEEPTQEAGFKISGAEPPRVVVTPEFSGKVFNYDAAISEARERLSNLNPAEAGMKLFQKEPLVKSEEAAKLLPAFERFLAKGGVVFIFKDKKFTVSPNEWGKWIKIEKRPAPELALAQNAVEGYFKEKIIPAVETPVEQARLVLEDSRVAEFQPSRAGELVDWQKMRPVIESTLLGGNGSREVAILTRAVEPEVTVASTNDLGIKEIIGIGKTTFAGSPANRRHNIRQGAKTLNGLLIAPGEPFSLLKALGPVDGEHGYLPELVIKKDKTVPEFGGGLCQIATTIFRAALNSGLPILERQSHSYRVPYYEPAGVDATIYDPKPDFRFLNDTGHYILIQSRVEGDNLVFEFWGAKDGRAVEQSKPIIYNVKPAPPSQLIETLDLPVGKKKCTEKAHAGADAVFTYTVTYASGDVKKQEFRSRYKPWGEVCLIGVEKLSAPPTPEGGEPSASSTVP